MKAKIRSIFCCGILMVILPYTGFPGSWKTFFSVLVGIIVCLCAYIIHRQLIGRTAKSAMATGRPTVTEAFVENRFTDKGGK